MLVKCPNCALPVLNTETVCPLCGALLNKGGKTSLKNRYSIRHLIGGLLIGSLAVGALFFGSIGSCLAKAFIQSLPSAGHGESISGIVNTLLLAGVALAITGGFIVGIWSILRDWKKPDD